MWPAHQRASTNFSGLFDLERRMSSSSFPVEAGLEDKQCRALQERQILFLGNHHQFHQNHMLRCQWLLNKHWESSLHEVNRQILTQKQEGRKAEEVQTSNAFRRLSETSIPPLLQMVFLLHRAQIKYLCSVGMHGVTIPCSPVFQSCMLVSSTCV